MSRVLVTTNKKPRLTVSLYGIIQSINKKSIINLRLRKSHFTFPFHSFIPKVNIEFKFYFKIVAVGIVYMAKVSKTINYGDIMNC